VVGGVQVRISRIREKEVI
jgi:hypothetical protein